MYYLNIILKGLWIGATMTVPGVSGGTMAVIVGIYEDLIHAVNHLREDPVKHLSFLFLFLLGSGSGFLLLARGITYLLENPVTEVATRFFFCGIVAGGSLILIRKAKVERITIGAILALLSGAVLVLTLSIIPAQNMLSGEGAAAMLIQFFVGILIAVALILPGISVTHVLYLFGLYQPVLTHIYRGEFLPLIPLAVGTLLGIFLVARLLEKLMTRYTTKVYLVILGFVAALVWSLIPKVLQPFPFMGVITFSIGFALSFWITRKE